MASFYSLGELILITPDLSSISIGFDTTDAFESQTITVAENKLTTTGASFGNIEENIYVNSSSDGYELLVKDGYKIKYVEYPKTVGNGGTLYKPGTTFNSVRDSTKTTYITIEAASSKVSIDLTTLSGWDNVTSGEHTIQVVAKATGYLDSEKSTAVTFTKASNKVLLEKGTYQFIESPNMNISTDETVDGKMYTLTADNTYGEQTSFDGISVVKSTAQIGQVFIGNSTSGYSVNCAGGDWKYINTDGDEFTATDTSKLRTIVLETDQYVSQEFYDWAITQGNLVKVKQSTGETWVLKSSDMTAPSNTIDETINFTNAANDNFTRINIYSEGKGVHISYFNNSAETDIITGDFGVTGDNATITFETAPTGDLLTWLQANGTKQGGTTVAHTLTWSDSTMVVTVNGNAVTSPYTLANGDKIVLKRTSGYQSYNIITNTGSFDTDTTQSPLAVNNSDIKLQNGDIDMSPSVHRGFTINYEENANSGGNIQ